MRKRYSTILLPIVILLFVGSSGCESSDMITVMEVLGGSQGVTPGDYIEYTAPKSWGGGSTGDKTKDDLIETAETMGDIKKAGELEDAANAAMGQDPPDYRTAIQKLEDALKLRPNDWSLENQLATLRLEHGGKDIGVFRGDASTGCMAAGDPAAVERCYKQLYRERIALLEASVERQKKDSRELVYCTTYEILQNTYLAMVYKDANGNSVLLPGYQEKIDHLRSLRKAGACTP